MYCALCRSEDNLDEIGQVIEERNTRKESALSILRGDVGNGMINRRE